MRLFIIFLILFVVFIRVVLDSETFQLKDVPAEEGLYNQSHFEWHWENFSDYLNAKYEKVFENIYGFFEKF